MASAKRNFRKNLPVLVSQRLVLRLLLMEQPELKEYALSALARNVVRCQVSVLGWALLGNHLHFILAQKIDGHDERRVVGIAAFMRNVSSMLARRINEYHSSQGHAVERTYHSHNLESPESLLRSLAYVNAQQAHHHAPLREGERRWDSWSVLAGGQPDGIVTDLPEFWQLLASSPAERVQRTRELLEAIIARALVLERESTPSPWAVATAEVTSTGHLPFTSTWQRLIPVTEALDPAAHHRARVAHLNRKWERVTFQQRPAPRVGDMLTIVVKREDRAPPRIRPCSP